MFDKKSFSAQEEEMLKFDSHLELTRVNSIYHG